MVLIKGSDMKNTWKFLKFNHYQFDSSESNTILVKFNSLSRHVSVKSQEGKELFEFKILGMLRSKLEIVDSKNTVLLKLETSRWWKSSWLGQSGKQKLEIKVVNRPWVEYVLLLDGEEILSYGLKPAGAKVVLSIQQFKPLPKQSDHFHVMLFSLIRPVLIESMGNQINIDH